MTQNIYWDINWRVNLLATFQSTESIVNTDCCCFQAFYRRQRELRTSTATIWEQICQISERISDCVLNTMFFLTHWRSRNIWHSSLRYRHCLSIKRTDQNVYTWSRASPAWLRVIRTSVVPTGEGKRCISPEQKLCETNQYQILDDWLCRRDEVNCTLGFYGGDSSCGWNIQFPVHGFTVSQFHSLLFTAKWTKSNIL